MEEWESIAYFQVYRLYLDYRIVDNILYIYQTIARDIWI